MITLAARKLGRARGLTEVAWLFEKRDCWLGVYWHYIAIGQGHYLETYVCVLPMLPLKLTWRW